MKKYWNSGAGEKKNRRCVANSCTTLLFTLSKTGSQLEVRHTHTNKPLVHTTHPTIWTTMALKDQSIYQSTFRIRWIWWSINSDPSTLLDMWTCREKRSTRVPSDRNIRRGMAAVKPGIVDMCITVLCGHPMRKNWYKWQPPKSQIKSEVFCGVCQQKNVNLLYEGGTGR